MKTELKNKNITKLSNIRKLKQDSIRKKYKKAFNIQKSVGKTLKKPLVLKDENDKHNKENKKSETKTKKQKIILND